MTYFEVILYKRKWIISSIISVSDIYIVWYLIMYTYIGFENSFFVFGLDKKCITHRIKT
jgi:hypothetical protein